jgi:hypothetical protein
MSPLVRISSAGISSLPGDLYLSKFAIAISTSKGLGSGTNGSAPSMEGSCEYIE